MCKIKFLLSFVFAFVFFTGAYAGEDLEAAVIVKKNGQKIECFIGRQTMLSQMLKKVSYKSDLNSSKQSIDIEEIHQVIFPSSNGDSVAIVENVEWIDAKDYMKNDLSKRKSQLMTVRRLGYMNVYSWTKYVNNVQEWRYYVCRKKNETVGVEANILVISPKNRGEGYKYAAFGKSFENTYERLFKECPDVVKSIKSGTLKAEDFEAIVEEYNVYMAEKGK